MTANTSSQFSGQPRPRTLGELQRIPDFDPRGVSRSVKDEIRRNLLRALEKGIHLKFRTIQQINGEGVTVLLVEQNTHHALGIASRGYVLETGRVVMTGTGQELLSNPQVREAYLGL